MAYRRGRLSHNAPPTSVDQSDPASSNSASGDRVPRLAAGLELSTSYELAEILQGDTHQAGDDVVQANQLKGAIEVFQAGRDFSGVGVVMDAEIESPIGGEPDFLCDVMRASRVWLAISCVSLIGHAFCNWL